jgi:hypothetical protein
MNAHARMAANDEPRSSGVWGYSTPSAYDSYVIFCVGHEIARQAAFKAWALANGIGFKSLLGSYKGQSETSFMVNDKQFFACDRWWADQETILRLSPLYRNGTLYGTREAALWRPSMVRSAFGDDLFVQVKGPEPIGTMREVTREYALAQSCWTYDPQSGLYWVAEQRKH